MPILTSNKSIKSQLVIFLIAGISLMIILLGILTVTVINQQSRELMLKNAFQMTEGLAKQAVYPILSGASKNAQEAMEHVTGFQSVIAVKLLLDDKTLFLANGSFPATITNNSSNKKTHSIIDSPTQVAQELPNYWLITTPVVLSVDSELSDEDEFELGESTSNTQIIGFVELLYSKESLTLIQSQVVITVASVGISFIIVMSLILRFGLSKLLMPLDKLANTMRNSEATGEHILADTNGAKEVRHMAIAYNKMMTVLDSQDERLKQHKSQLEAEVKLQTKDLIDARDAALIASKHKSEFMANMSHELRTPIQSIVGYSELVIEELEVDGNAILIEDMDKILANSQRLLQMINSLLDLAKIEAGKLDINISEISLPHLTATLVDTIQPLAQKNKIAFRVNQCQEITHFYQDKDKLEQVLINLLSNACKFTPSGSINLTISLNAKDNQITFKVEDSGIGLTQDQQRYIFEEFRQVDSGQNRKFNGTGLGLTICQRFVTLMQGDIKVTSKLDKGSTFIVELPLLPSTKNEKTS